MPLKREKCFFQRILAYISREDYVFEKKKKIVFSKNKKLKVEGTFMSLASWIL